LTSIHWREAWKYGERAYRYCQHDAGHALAALSIAAALHGWRAHWLSHVGDNDLSRLLGIDRDSDFGDAEREAPDFLLAVSPGSMASANLPLTLDGIEDISKGSWFGRANRLSVEHSEWPIIDETAEHCIKPVTANIAVGADDDVVGPPLEADRMGMSARQIILQRRSALALDGRTTITAKQFFLILDRVMPRADVPPFYTLGPPISIHLALFVHRVVDLDPGLYMLVRHRDALQPLRAAMDPSFDWSRPDGCPESIPVYQLASGDARPLAAQLSCGQDIGADGAFACAMIAEFAAPLRTHGAWFYRRLHWEAGAIGQVLYLEAEAAGIRATGIGCFFDDPTHELLGLRDTAYQAIYYFTMGGAKEDLRLMSWPPYPAR
jgi:nitroreductase